MKEYIVAIFNSLLIPLAVLSGVALSNNNIPLLIAFMLICIGIEFASTLLWFKVNREIHLR